MIVTEHPRPGRIGPTHAGYAVVILLIIAVLLGGGYMALMPLLHPRSASLVSIVDRAIGQTGTRPDDAGHWLTVDAPTQTYWLNGSPAWVALPGQRYRVLHRDAGWAFIRYEKDPPQTVVWMNLAPWVHISH